MTAIRYHERDGVTVWQADALHVSDFLAPESVDLIVTSPPYWGLRTYRDGGEAYQGQVGSEATPQEFVNALIACTAEWLRVLKPTGSLWVNLGDKYAGSGGHNNATVGAPVDRGPRNYSKASSGVPRKSLMGLPWRYAIRAVDELGLTLRAEVIWSKPNPIPDTAKDRVARAHEQWFHFTRRGDYYADIDRVRIAYVAETAPERGPSGYALGNRNDANRPRPWAPLHSLGKVLGSVWSVTSEALRVPPELGEHFAAFPSEFPRRIIAGWSPTGWCTACGEPRRAATETTRTLPWGDDGLRGKRTPPRASDDKARGSGANFRTDVTITGETCGCPEPTAPTRPAVVLDPFGGTGTTALVARLLGREAHTVDLSADYCRLAVWRIWDDEATARRVRERTHGKPRKRVNVRRPKWTQLELPL